MDYGDIVADPQLEHKPPDTTQSFRSSRHDYTPEGFPDHFLVSYQGGSLLSPGQTHCLRKVMCIFIVIHFFLTTYLFILVTIRPPCCYMVQTASTKQYDLSRPPHNNPNLTRCEMSFLAVLS